MDYKSIVLKNRHVLNFFDISLNIDIPKWFAPYEPRLWVGDADCPLSYFKNASKDLYYNVFYCYPETDPDDGYKYLSDNLNYLKQTYGESKYLICLIDITNKIQSEKFSTIFVDYFHEYKVRGNSLGGTFELVNEILKFKKHQFNINYLLEFDEDRNELMKFNKEQFEIVHQFIISNYKNKNAIFMELYDNHQKYIIFYPPFDNLTTLFGPFIKNESVILYTKL